MQLYWNENYQSKLFCFAFEAAERNSLLSSFTPNCGLFCAKKLKANRPDILTAYLGRLDFRAALLS